MNANLLGGIYSNNMSSEHRYANTALEALSILDATKNIYISQNNPYMNQTLLTSKFIDLLKTLYFTNNDACNIELINAYINHAKSSNNNQSLFQNPYNFLIFFLQFLDEEFNKVYNIQINFPRNNFQDMSSAAMNLQNFRRSTRFSPIFQNFYFPVVLNQNCRSCGLSRIEWTFEKSINIDLDNYKSRKQGTITLNECLQYYISSENVLCRNCRQFSCFQTRMLFNTGKVLIINIQKRNYSGNPDPFFKIDININVSQYKDSPQNLQYVYYTLKSRILYAGQQYGYFTDCLVKKNPNMAGTWCRYCDSNKNQINENQLNDFETILLIYEMGMNNMVSKYNMNNNIQNQNVNSYQSNYPMNNNNNNRNF